MNNQNNRLKIEFTSGALGAIVSTTVMQPVDVARNRTSVQFMSKIKQKYRGFTHTFRTILKEEGFKGFYSGYSISIISTPIFHASFFVTYETSKVKLKKYLYGEDQQLSYKQQCLINAISSFMSGAMSVTITNPLWVSRLRVQTQNLNKHSKYGGLVSTLKLIYKEEGIINGLFKGMTISYIGLVHPVIYFLIYESMKSKFTDNHTKQISDWQVIFSSAFSKIIALVITYPHVILRNRVQFQSHKNSNQAVNLIMNIATNTYKKQGLKGFYAGINFELFRVLPQNIIVFYIYEMTKVQLSKYYKIH